MNIVFGILIPFLGTTLGAACVYFLRNELNPRIQKMLLGFASGVMTAASVWSLIIPSIDSSHAMGTFSFVPAAAGIALGIAFLFFLDEIIPHLHAHSEKPEGPESHLPQKTMMFLAVTLHNIPEGMAVGVVFAALAAESPGVSIAAAAALSIGIAVQNFPEGAIVSLSQAEKGQSRHKAFAYGVASGAVEPAAAVITILLKSVIAALLPYLLSFAAGAMLYVVVEELIPEASREPHSNLGTIGFASGFILMMILDVALG